MNNIHLLAWLVFDAFQAEILNGQRLLFSSIVHGDIARHEDLCRLPDENGQANAVFKGFFCGIVKILQPEVEYLFLWLLIFLTANPEPLDQGDVANGGLQIPVWGL